MIPVFFGMTAKTLIGLDQCAGLCESSLCTHNIRYIISHYRSYSSEMNSWYIHPIASNKRTVTKIIFLLSRQKHVVGSHSQQCLKSNLANKALYDKVMV